MASLASSAITVISNDTSGGHTGKRWSEDYVTVALTGQGGGTNKILASAFGFSTFIDSSPWVSSDNTQILTAAPSYDKTYLQLVTSGGVTAADATGTFQARVRGISLPSQSNSYL